MELLENIYPLYNSNARLINISEVFQSIFIEEKDTYLPIYVSLHSSSSPPSPRGRKKTPLCSRNPPGSSGSRCTTRKPSTPRHSSWPGELAFLTSCLAEAFNKENNQLL